MLTELNEIKCMRSACPFNRQFLVRPPAMQAKPARR